MAILTWHRNYGDQLRRFPKARPFHCTPDGLTFAIAPNVGDSDALFLSVGSAYALTPIIKSKIDSILIAQLVCY